MSPQWAPDPLGRLHPKVRRASAVLPHSFHDIIDHLGNAPRRERLALADQMILLPLTAHAALLNFLRGKFTWDQAVRYGYKNGKPLD